MPSEAQRIDVHKMGETPPQPAGEKHKPDSRSVSSLTALILNFSVRNIANAM